MLFGALRGDEQAKWGSVLWKVKFELRSVGIGGFQRRIERRPMSGRRRIFTPALVDEPNVAGVRYEGGVLEASGRDCGLVEARAQRHEVSSRRGGRLGFDVRHRIGQVAVDLAEVL